jgi:hypothetical protein
MTPSKLLPLGLAVVLGALGASAVGAQPAGRMTGGQQYEIPEWFTQSFLDIADDAAEAAEADRHAMLFIHADE